MKIEISGASAELDTSYSGGGFAADLVHFTSAQGEHCFVPLALVQAIYQLA